MRMSVIVGSHWKSFRLGNKERRWLFVNGKSMIRLRGKEYFDRNTIEIIVCNGYETKENDVEPISDTIWHIEIVHGVANYFSENSMRSKSKRYIVIGEEIYQQFGHRKSKRVNRMSGELRGVLEELSRIVG